MKQLCILAFSVLLLAAAAPGKSSVDQDYQEGQRLFLEKNFTAALEKFERVDKAVPNDPRVDSWIAACLNELGKYAEAKERLEAAFKLLRDAQSRAVEQKKPVTPIDVGYFTLLARIQMNLGEFEQAIETIRSYSPPDDGSEEAAKAKQAIDTARQILKAKLVAVGAECLRSGDLDCTRKRFTQADKLEPASPSVRARIARDALIRAEKAPGATDADKAKKVALFQTAVQASRLWLEEAGPAAADAQRVVAKALVGTKTHEGYEEAIRILTALWAGSADQAQKDRSIQLELAVAHSGLEQWELAVTAASTFIQLEPNDPLGQGYCQRSFGQFQLGRCREAISDGQYCKNSDGSPRQLKHVEICQQRLAKQEADKAAVQEAARKRRCEHLTERVAWARNFPTDIALDDLVQIVADFKAGEAECRPYIEATDTMPALCAGGAKTASSPFNLSTRSKKELEALRATTKELLKLCGSFLDTAQMQGVQGGLHKVESALE